jgi:hypothetical protein
MDGLGELELARKEVRHRRSWHHRQLTVNRQLQNANASLLSACDRLDRIANFSTNLRAEIGALEREKNELAAENALLKHQLENQKKPVSRGARLPQQSVYSSPVGVRARQPSGILDSVKEPSPMRLDTVCTSTHPVLSL